MPLEYPTFNAIIEQGVAELRKRLPEVDPTIFNSWASTFINGCGAYAYTLILLIRDLEGQLFIQTANGEFLDRLGGLIGQDRNTAEGARGPVSLPGVAGTVVPVGTLYQGSNGVEYAVDTVGTVQDVTQAILSIERVGGTAIATVSSDHQLSTGLDVTISGANESEYNGTFLIAVSSRNQFQYSVSGSPSTPATGTINYVSTFAPTSVEASATGLDTNLDSGALLTLQSVVSGMGSTGFVQVDGLTGGTGIESDENYKERLLLAAKTIEGVFTTDQVKLATLDVSGNTRAFVVNPELSTCASNAGSAGFIPTPGQVAVYPLRDGDANIVPSQTILDETKQSIIENGALPSHTAESDVFVLAARTDEIDFDFLSISPDTVTMQNAIESTLSAFFEDTVDFQEDVTQASYLGAIQATQDLQTGAFLDSFSLNSPTSDIIVSNGGIAVLGSVTF